MPELTMMKVRVEHLEYIQAQLRDEDKRAVLSNPAYTAVLAQGYGLSFWFNSRCVGAAGIIRMHEYKALAWALLSPASGIHMYQITKWVRQALDVQPYPRVEMYVECDFPDGHRWAKLLGFELEAPRMAKSGVTGADEALYARVK